MMADTGRRLLDEKSERLKEDLFFVAAAATGGGVGGFGVSVRWVCLLGQSELFSSEQK
jgi:hypothetical protein